MFKLKELAVFCTPLSLVISPIYANTASALISFPSPGAALVKQATYIKPLDPTKIMHLYVSLKLRNKEQLDKLVGEIYDPQSPNYHKYLSHDEFERQFAPTKEAENDIVRYFSSQGMHAKTINHAIHVTATVQQVEQALKTQINQYHYQNRKVFANASAPKLTADIAPYILEIRGLTNIIQYVSTGRAATFNTELKNQKPQPLNLLWDSFVPTVLPTTASIGGITGAQLQNVYQSNNIYIGGVLINGAGQTMVIVDACENNNATIIRTNANQYNTNNGLTPFTASNFKILNSDALTPYTNCNARSTGSDGEIALDVQASHTIAPGANTVLVLDNQGLGYDRVLMNVIGVLLHNATPPAPSIGGLPNAYVVSNSWTNFFETDADNLSLDVLLESAAAFGISINFSTGDCGDNSYNSTWGCTVDQAAPSVNYPASSPYVTAVGGTSLFVSSDWQYAFETGWGTYNNGGISGAAVGYYSGSTGGLSTLFNTTNTPGLGSWQGNTNNFSSFIASGYNRAVGTARAVPDIAMLADAQMGLKIYFQGAFATPETYGGTSLACPLFSGTLTLVNQAIQLNSGTSIGQAAPILYTHYNNLYANGALNPINPPHQIISGATLPNITGIPHSSFMIGNVVYGWDASLSDTPMPNQFWNDMVGVGSPNIPNFVAYMSTQ